MAWKMMDGYEMVIGLEVHVELKTKTKIFCACPTTFGAAPNTQCCPVCMGFPGTLPVLNRQVVHYAVLGGWRRAARLRVTPSRTERIISILICPKRTKSASMTCRCALAVT